MVIDPHSTCVCVLCLCFFDQTHIAPLNRSLNKAGTITHYMNVTLEISKQKQNEWLYVTKLGKQKIIHGLPWLQRENPLIDWKIKTINWRDESHLQPSFKASLEEEEDEPTISTQNSTQNSELLLNSSP